MLQSTSKVNIAGPGSTDPTVRLICTLIVLVLYVILVIITTTCVVYRHVYMQIPLLSARLSSLVIVQAVVGAFAGIASLVCTVLYRYPCALKLWIIYTGVLVWLFVIAARAAQQSVLAFSCPQKPTALQQQLISSNQIYIDCMEAVTSNIQATQHNAQMLIIDSRPATGRMTFSTWSELDLPLSHSLFAPPNPCNVDSLLKIQQPRFGKWVATRALLSFLVLFGGLLALVALVANVKLPPFRAGNWSIHGICSDGGWVMWLAYGIAIAVTGLVFPALVVRIWKTENIYGIRTDLLTCIICAQMAAVLYALWVTVMDTVRENVSELFVVWLAMLCTHVSSVCVPLWRSHRHHDCVDTKKSQTSLNNTYAVPHSQSGLRSPLFDEFHQAMLNRTQREAFLTFARQYYRSTLPEFLRDYQLLKYKTIEALWQTQRNRYFACCQHHCHLQSCKSFYCYIKSKTASRPGSTNAVPSRCPVDLTQYNKIQRSGPYTDAECLQQHRILKVASIQTTAANNHQFSPDNHPLAALVPITKGIYESSVAVLPPRSVDQNTMFPEAVKSVFANFVHTYFGKAPCTSVDIPSKIISEVQAAVEQSNVHLSILDNAKDEVLLLLCTDVFTGYRRHMAARESQVSQSL